MKAGGNYGSNNTHYDSNHVCIMGKRCIQPLHSTPLPLSNSSIDYMIHMLHTLIPSDENNILMFTKQSHSHVPSSAGLFLFLIEQIVSDSVASTAGLQANEPALAGVYRSSDDVSLNKDKE